MDTIQKFLSYARIYYLDDKIAEIAVNVRKNYQLKLPDSVVAATALLHNFKLITADNQFKRIADLSISFISHL